MKEELFIKNNSNIWQELEVLSTTINKKGIKSLPSKEVKRFLYLFRQVSHQLAYARTHYHGSTTVKYLNSLIGNCHSNIYSVNKFSFKDIIEYISYGFPKLLKEFRWFFLSSFGFFMLGTLISFISILMYPNSAGIFVSNDMIEAMKNGASSGNSSANWNYPLVSSFIMFNNITVSLKALVYGFTLGLGTIYALFTNGILLGGLAALSVLYGGQLRFWSLILPHGFIELTAIFVSGAAGLIIAKSMLLPGEYSRVHSTIAGAKKAVSFVFGIILMLIIAGTIEGFFTPLNINPGYKLLFAAVTFLLLLTYFSIPYFIKRSDK